eukprot:jgi/Orpsp1_1/1185482/evm.model.c7180000093979.1
MFKSLYLTAKEYPIKYKTSKEFLLKDNKKWHPLLKAIIDNNSDKVKTIINEANENNTILELNTKNKKGEYPLLKAIDNDNIEI